MFTECVAEGDDYLACIGESDVASDFICFDGKPDYVGEDCDSLYGLWIICSGL